MKEELKEIEHKIMSFCEKYNCSLETNTLRNGRDNKGDIVVIKVCSKIIT